MEKTTYEQLDRIENGIAQVLEQQQIQNENDEITLLQDFYEQEVQNQNGQLHHLKEDRILQKYIENLEQQQEEQDLEENEKYNNHSFE